MHLLSNEPDLSIFKEFAIDLPCRKLVDLFKSITGKIDLDGFICEILKEVFAHDALRKLVDSPLKAPINLEIFIQVYLRLPELVGLTCCGCREEDILHGLDSSYIKLELNVVGFFPLSTRLIVYRINEPEIFQGAFDFGTSYESVALLGLYSDFVVSLHVKLLSGLFAL